MGHHLSHGKVGFAAVLDPDRAAHPGFPPATFRADDLSRRSFSNDNLAA